MATLVATLGLSGREPLDDAVTSQHTTIDRELTTHHEGSHGSILLSQDIRFVGQIRLVLATVDQHEACEAAGVAIARVRRIRPSAAPAEAWKEKPLVSPLLS